MLALPPCSDLKSKNVLLTRDGRAKVSDVGTAALHSATYLATDASRFAGTLAWAAPELLIGHRISAKADMYSFGVVLWCAREEAGQAAWHAAGLAGGGSTGTSGRPVSTGRRRTPHVPPFPPLCHRELATAKTPRRGEVEPLPPGPNCPPGLAAVMADCMQPDPAARPTAAEALQRLREL